MAETVSWAYNGSTTITAIVRSAVVASEYRLSANDPQSSADVETAVTDTLVLTITDVGGLSGGDPFQALMEVNGDPLATHDFVYGTPVVAPSLAVMTAAGLAPGSFTTRRTVT